MSPVRASELFVGGTTVFAIVESSCFRLRVDYIKGMSDRATLEHLARGDRIGEAVDTREKLKLHWPLRVPTLGPAPGRAFKAEAHAIPDAPFGAVDNGAPPATRVYDSPDEPWIIPPAGDEAPPPPRTTYAVEYDFEGSEDWLRVLPRPVHRPLKRPLAECHEPKVLRLWVDALTDTPAQHGRAFSSARALLETWLAVIAEEAQSEHDAQWPDRRKAAAVARLQELALDDARGQGIG